ncbi:unnamed protein product [Closterium sp. NIES-53]
MCVIYPLPLVEPVEVTVDLGAARGAASGGVEPASAEPGGAECASVEPGVAEPEGAEPGGAESESAESGGAEPRGTASAGGPARASPRQSHRACTRGTGVAGAGGVRGAGARDPGAGGPAVGGTRGGGAGATSPGGAGVTAGAGGSGGARAAGPRGARTRDTGAAAADGVGAGGTGAGGAEAGGAGAGGPGAGGTGAGGTGAGDPRAGGARAGDPGAGGAGAGVARSGGTGAGGTVQRRPFFIPPPPSSLPPPDSVLRQVLSVPSSTILNPSLLCPPPHQLQPQLQPDSPLLAPSPYAKQTDSLTERREPESRPALPVYAVCTGRRVPCPCPPPVPYCLLLRSLFLMARTLIAELVDFAAACRLDYAASLVAGSESNYPPPVVGECALGMDVIEDRQEDFECLAATVPHLVAMLLAPEGDPDAPDILTPRSYAEAITGPYSSQRETAIDAEMASWKSTGTFVNTIPPPWANIVDGMRIFRVKRPSGSPPVFKARYIARGFSQRQGVHFFQTFSPTSKMTTLPVLLHVVAHRDYELHSLDFSTAFLQGSLHEEIWLHRPPNFTGSFPAGTQWSLRRPVYGLRQAPREWHDTLRTTLAALGFAPLTTGPSLILRIDTSLPPIYILVYMDNLVFATADTEAPALVKSELQKRHTCTDLGELRSYLGLHITRDRARRTITLTQSHMVHQVLHRFGFRYSLPQSTPLPTGHSLSTPPSDESVELCGLYPELVGCLMYLMTCTRPDLAYPLSILARYAAHGRHQPEHSEAAKMVLRYLCSTSGMGLVIGGRGPVVLTGHANASWVDDLATQRSSQCYTFSLGSGFISWRSTRSSSVLSSSCEAEMYAGDMAAQELRWLTYLLTDLGERPRSPPILYVDNKAMIALCQEHSLEHRTKHIALHYFLARELQQLGQLRLSYMATRANTAEIFTKALQPGDHQRPATEPFETLHLDVWGPASRPGLERESFFLLVVEDYSRYTTVFPLAKNCDATSTLIRWLFATEGTHQRRPPQQNGVAENRIGLVMEIARTSMIHAHAPHFLWPYAVRYTTHQLNLLPRVSRPGVSPTSLWTGSHLTPFYVSSFYHPPLHRFLDSRDVSFDNSVPYYTQYPCRYLPVPPPPLFLTPTLPPAPPVLSPSPHSSSQPPQQPSPLPPQAASYPEGAGVGSTDPRGAASGGVGVGAADETGPTTAADGHRSSLASPVEQSLIHLDLHRAVPRRPAATVHAAPGRVGFLEEISGTLPVGEALAVDATLASQSAHQHRHIQFARPTSTSRRQYRPGACGRWACVSERGGENHGSVKKGEVAFDYVEEKLVSGVSRGVSELCCYNCM